MIPITDLDYVKLYAKKLKKDKSLFEQQKKLIESQMKSSSELAKKMFGEKDFEINARKYLRKINLL
jgi:uncharacterized ion transporter superfamily protein YfcC